MTNPIRTEATPAIVTVQESIAPAAGMLPGGAPPDKKMPTTVPGSADEFQTTAVPQTKLDKAMTGLKEKVVTLFWDNAAAEHEVKVGETTYTHTRGSLTGNFKIAEKIAITGTPVFAALVAADTRRSAHVAANPNQIWIATRGTARGSASIPVGYGAALGFSAEVKVSSVAAHELDSVKDVKGAIVGQTKSMVLPFTAEGLLKMKAAHGSEWAFEGSDSGQVSIGWSASQTQTAGIVTGTAAVGVSAALSTSDVYLKRVKVLDDTHVFVQVSSQDTDTGSVAAGATAGIDIATEGKIEDFAGKLVERRVSAGASIWGSISKGEKVLGAAVLDISTPAGKKAYDRIMRSSPIAAAEFINSEGLGAKYTGDTKTTAAGVTAHVGGFDVLSTSTITRTERGLLVEIDKKETTMSEAEYARNISGWLPRLVLNEERNATVRLTRSNDGQRQEEELALALSVKDTDMTATELAQIGEFGKTMESPVVGLPPAPRKGSYGKASYQLSIGISNEGVQRLKTHSEQALRDAVAEAHQAIDGGKIPPWHTDPGFSFYRDELTSPNAEETRKTFILAEYQKVHPGRDLQKDIDSERATNRFVKAVAEAKKGNHTSLSEWKGVLKSIGSQPSGDVRALALAMKKLAGAKLVSLTVTADGKTGSAASQGPAPKSVAQIIGPLLDVPN